MKKGPFIFENGAIYEGVIYYIFDCNIVIRNDQETQGKGLENKHGLMELNMKDIGKTIRPMDKESSGMLMVTSMKVIIIVINLI